MSPSGKGSIVAPARERGAAPGAAPVVIPLVLSPPAGERGIPLRAREPLTIGVPFPRGAVRDASFLSLSGDGGNTEPLQVQVLDRWPDGSCRWALVDFQAHSARHYALTVLTGGTPGSETPIAPAIRTERTGAGVIVETGAARFRIEPGRGALFAEVVVAGAPVVDARRTGVEAEDADGPLTVRTDRVSIELEGPLRTVVAVEGRIGAAGARPRLETMLRMHFFAGSATVRFALTVRNSRKADHPGGYWDLGARGSVFVRDLSATIVLPEGSPAAEVRCAAEAGDILQRREAPFELYQDSSGGPNWNGTNHLNRDGTVPAAFSGYRLLSGGEERTGRRATPVVTMASGDRSVAVATQHFWQNCPKAIEAGRDFVRLRLFPRQYGDVHEIQGGEQKTHIFAVAFGTDGVSATPLDWCRAPLLARAEPSWYCASGALGYLLPSADDPHRAHVELIAAGVSPDNGFAQKREVIDEYGWRNFGEIYADHEDVFRTGAAPLVSHYNNQYDAVAGFARQFFRSGDTRWWHLFDELARHVVDIDIYHTTEDKPAYNGGLFWHTNHHVDAHTSTHRSYPRAAGAGGGPCVEHNYTTGLMLHYFLTGDVQSRDAAIGLGRWVVAMDDGSATPFWWLARQPTGLASATADPEYHGPGRASAHGINALLDAWRLSGDRSLLAAAEGLIRRCIHPEDDIDGRELLDAERRWSYTAFLQVLGQYLDEKQTAGELDAMYAYARAALLHYARWMASHERPYLDASERLQFPNETWVAQDIRKSDVFVFAALHAEGEERVRFLERAEYFFNYVTTTLAASPGATLARPMVLLLSYGLMLGYLKRHPSIAAPPPPASVPFPPPQQFVPQKIVAMRRVKRWTPLVAVGFTALLVAVAAWML
jgi:hypothetical protein